MRLLLNDEQRMLREAAHAFFQERMPVAGLRALRDRRDALGYEPELWREMAAMGWAGILVPETHGGTGFGYKGLGQVLEEAGRTLAASPLVSTALTAAPLVAACGSEAQAADVLGAIARGDRIVALALEEGPRHDPTAIATRAERTGRGYRLHGRKTFVLDGHVADQIIVVARTAGRPGDAAGLTLFLVPGDASGLRRTRTFMVDSRNAAALDLDGADVPDEAVLGSPNGAFAPLDRALDGARAGLAAEMLGSGAEAFERTLAYLRMREQFGVPIGTFQALKHRAALMFCEIELTRSAVLDALEALDEGRDDASAAASLAKAKAAEMLELVSNEAVQMHGGIGMTDETDIGLFLKRARVAQQTFGDALFHRMRYADLQAF